MLVKISLVLVSCFFIFSYDPSICPDSPGFQFQDANIANVSHMATSWTIRRAKASDLDALTWIAIDAFPHDPQWIYRYPHATEFPEDHLKYTQRRYGEWLEANTTPRCIIMVAECPSLEDPSVRKVVALSIWRLPDRGGAEGDISDKCSLPILSAHYRLPITHRCMVQLLNRFIS